MHLTLNPILKNKTTWLAMFLSMTEASVASIAIIYATTLILSYYPASYLIYYTVIQVLFSAFLRTIIGRLVKGDYKKVALIQYLIFITFFLLVILMMNVKTYETPFIVAVLILGVPALSTITVSNILSLSFGLREFKNVSQYLQLSAIFGFIISNFSVPLFVSFFSYTYLVIVAALLYVICFFVTYHLPVQKIQVQQDHKKQKSKPTKLPLYYYMMIFSTLAATISIMTSYTMKLELGKYYSHEQLSSFLGYLGGVTDILSFTVSCTTRIVLKRFGLNKTIYLTPLISLIFSIIAIIFPSFWSVILLNSIRQIVSGSYGSVTSEILYNALPQEVRFVSKANIKATASIVSTFLLVIFTLGITNTFFINLWLPPLCLLAIFIGYKVIQYYKKTLQQEADFKRYNLLDEVTPATRPYLEEVALKSLKSKDISTIFYGLDLSAKLYETQEPPQELFVLLNHNNAIVRKEVLEFINKRNSPSSMPFLKQRLPDETDSEIQLKIVEEIVRQDETTSFSDLQTTNLNQDDGVLLKNLFEFLQSDKKNKALQKIRDLSQHSNPQIRKMVAFTIGNFKMLDLADTLKKLIFDEQEQVSEEALNSVRKIQAAELIPDVLKLALENKKRTSPQYTLACFGNAALPFLIKQALNIKDAKIIIKVVSSIPGTQAEQTLIAMLENVTPYIRSLVAKYANEMACKYLPSDDFKTKAQTLITEECSIIFDLQNKLTSVSNPKIKKEIGLRISLAKIRFLQWLAIATRPRAVNQLMASLKNQDSGNKRVLDKAIELLEIYVKDVKTHEYLNFVLENQTPEKDLILPINYHDNMLELMMNPSENKTETSLVSILFELRSIRLFEDLPAEVLLAVAEEIQYLSYAAGEVIFQKDDLPDGLYCVSIGEVSIIHNDKVITTISEHGFFGELALLDNAPRVASAVAKTPCTIMYIEKGVFNRIADDVPELLRTLSKVILEYARKNLELVS